MKKRKIIISLLMFSLICLSTSAFADSFVVKDIRLDGERHVTLATVLSYLPIKKGDEIDNQRVRGALSALYKTGLFNDVVLLREGNTLIVQVDERPAIAEVNIKGNNKIEDDMLKKAFDDAGLVAGRIYNANVLDRMRKELETVYYSLGRYGIKMNAEVTELPRHRVKIDIDIEEGLQAKIKHINIVGNTVFTDEQLLDDLKSGIPSWWAVFSSKDKYEKSKLNADLEAINSYYLDRGYLDFKMESTQVSISDDKKDIYVTINVTEGEQYKISKLQYAGELVLADEDYDAVLNKTLSVGDVFSRKKVNETILQMKDNLGAVGYPYADIIPSTDVEKKEKTVALVFNVNPGNKVYINQILFKGNDKTVDKVYRRELRQMESALYNSKLVERSRVRIQRLEYVGNVRVTKEPVAGKKDAVNLVYDIKERLAGSFNAGLGLSDSGTSFNFGITQSNLFGSGNALSLNLAKSNTIENYNISYRNPYYKTDNMSRTLRFNYREFDATDEEISAEYLLNTLDVGATYGMPLSEYSRLSYGFSLGYNEVLPVDTDANGDSTIQQIKDFVAENGTNNNYLRLNLSYSVDKRDRRIFARKGSLNRLRLDWTTPISEVAYYKYSYLGEKYFATDIGSLLLKARLAYGAGTSGASDLPFYEKYLAGGIRSLRGFDSRSIGPLEIFTDPASTEMAEPLGGNLSTIGTIEWLFNAAFLGSSSQLSVFYDFGSVFDDTNAFDASEFRSSVGIAYNWLSPVGPLVFSYGWPLEKKEGDVTQRFQFTLGTSF